ncbi:26S proteasome complex subunit [Lepraria neglecta]|uniref:26S proteasome complex subunit SEM1 n=1 Tax=Lepraria neglecta TaxID=209136 RepID=A0AAD9ZCX6_9LECA|nr:26S proteasome complex subunit [Lepraria neglecta]
MSAAAEGSGPTTKATTSDAANSSTLKDQQKPATALEEDDEFEDFPVDDWAPEDSEVPPGSEGGTTHLWEESWDDDDTSEDFSKQLKDELAKVKGQK